jgi:hypothetical protein
VGLNALPDAPMHLSTDAVRLMLALRDAVPPHTTVRLRHAPDRAGPCDAVDTALGADLPADDLHQLGNAALEVIVRAGAALGDRAFGRLQVQLVDGDTKRASTWSDVPGVFVRAPAVTRIECPKEPDAICTLLGTDLTSIDAVGDGSGPFVAPDFDCTSAEKGLACVHVPHLAHYVVRLGDRSTLVPLADGLITGAHPAPSPSPR